MAQYWKNRNPTATRPLFSKKRNQIAAFLQRQKNLDSGFPEDCNVLVDANGDYVLDANGNYICMQDAVSRYFTELDSTVDQDYMASSSVNVTRIVMDVYSNGTSNDGLPTGAPLLVANEFQTIDFLHTGSLGEIGRNGVDYFDGYIANVQWYDGAALRVDSPIDENLANTSVVRNNAAVLGSELSEIITPIQKTGNSTLVLQPDIDMVQGGSYLTIIDVDNTPAAATPGVRVGGIVFNNRIPIGFVGEVEILVTPASTGEFSVQIIGSAARTIVNSVSIKEIPAATPYFTAQNIVESTLFDQASDRWTGQELVVNGGFDTDTDWTKGSGWSISQGQARHDGSSAFSALSQPSLDITIGMAYRKEYSITEVFGSTSAALLDQLSGPSLGYGTAGGVGVYKIDSVADTAFKRILSGSAPSGGAITNISIKQFLELAP